MREKALNAIKRCYDTRFDSYEGWGGRGIRVLREWIDNIETFVEYLMQLPGAEDPILILDRIDNDGCYVPGNLRFTTWTESRQNVRKRRGKRLMWKYSGRIRLRVLSELEMEDVRFNEECRRIFV